MEPFKQKSTIFLKIVVLFIVLIVSITSISTYISIHYESKVTKESIISTGKYISEFIASSTENAFFSLNWIFVNKMLHDTVRFMDDQLIYALLIRENGKIYMASDDIYKNEYFEIEKFEHEITIIEGYEFPGDGQQGILMAKILNIGKNQFYVVLGLSIEPIHQKNKAILIRNIYIGLLSILAGVFFALLTSRNISGPITRLANAVNEINPSNMVLDVDIGSTDEVGVLENRFKTMLANLRATQSDLELSKVKQENIAAKLQIANDELEFRVQERTQELLEAKNYIDDIINSMPSALVGVDEECRITQCNIQVEKLANIKISDAMNRKLTDVFPQMTSQIDKIKKAITVGEIQFAPKQRQVKGEQTICEDITIYPLVASDLKGAVIRIDDVTEKMAMEEIIMQSEKMLSVGGLAAGMAHEINNPLAGIMQNTALILSRVQTDLPANTDAARESGTTMEAIRSFMSKRKIIHHLERIHEAGSKAAKIVQNMLSFSRPDKSGKTQNNLVELFEQTLELIANDYDLKNKYDFKQVKIIREYEPDLPNVPCEASKIQQVFFNILKNGAQAMYESQTVPSQFILRVSREGKMIRVEIQDNGPGMDEEIRRHLFEPFYTTKEIGVGTGLGLSISYFIIKESHQGTIDVESFPGKGTTFIIRLPLKDGHFV